ncbi:MAG: ABC transporter ATP-binding protein [Euryarchaeota archaeon]|nr:ABC transporter ATP-binding protein [Euryarchaeota archaeon]
MSALLEIDAIDTYYGSVQILHGLELKVPEGKIVAIIGPNGAGKSTALRSIFGLVPVKAGRIRFAGEDITDHKPADLVRRGISYVPQGRAVFPSLTVSENLDMGGFILRDDKKVKEARESIYDLFPILRERRRQVATTLSGGEQQLLAMGRALMVRPRLLLLDEPSIGLAPKVVEEVLGRVREINQQGTTICMVEQNAARALAMSDHAYVLVVGRTRLQGPGPDLLNDPKVRAIYLGMDTSTTADAE